MEFDDRKLRIFWELIKPSKKTERTEIRLLAPVDKTTFYALLRKFAEENPDILFRNYTQFFVDSYEDFEKVLSYNDNYFRLYSKPCYGISAREVVNYDIGGSYEYVKTARFIFFDFDKKDHTSLNDREQELLDEYIDNIILPALKQYGLEHPIIVHSGGGRHLLYRIKEQALTLPRKEWYKALSKNLSKSLSNDLFEIDACYDFTRVFSIPETMNVKRKVKVTLKRADTTVNDKFRLKSLKVIAPTHEEKIQVDDLPEITQSLEWAIITSRDAPIGEIHNTVLFALKLLCKAKGVVDGRAIERHILFRGANYKLNLNAGLDSKEYSPGIIINWCKRHMDWVEANHDILILYEKYIDAAMRRRAQHEKTE